MRTMMSMVVLIASTGVAGAQTIYHENGERAWGGYDGATVYHASGERAWSGYKGATVYHASGERAWSGYEGATVYHANGERAWSGYAGATLYAASGNTICSSVDGIDLAIGEGLVLHIRLKPHYHAWLTVVCRDIEIESKAPEKQQCCGCSSCRCCK